ncbi:hypothetical protein EOL73_01765 [Candidatus Saccharibacteria bacterium]|nr:hypothetical protein [Candidatus Saccharibacteria bacterium]
MNVSQEDMSRIFEEVQSLDSTNDRFKYLKVRRRDKWYFVKIAQNDTAREGLLREYLWSEFMERVSVLMPFLKLDGPHIFKRIGTGALVIDWIEASVVAEAWDIDAWQRNLERFASMHVQLDRAAGNYSLPQVYTKLAHRDTPETTWKQWSTDRVDEQTISDSRQLFREYEYRVTLRLQHGDLWPWEIFNVDDRWVIIDGEKAGIDLPRFYDVAQSYVRLFTIANNQDMARDFLRMVIDGLEMSRDDFYSQFIPVVLIRAISQLSNANSGDDESLKASSNLLVNTCLLREVEQIF